MEINKNVRLWKKEGKGRNMENQVLTIEDRTKNIMELRKQGLTCSQIVLHVYADLLEMKEEDLFRMSEGFGGGMGGMMGTCGAVTAMVIAAGLVNSCGDPGKCDSKASTMKLVREMTAEFQKKNQSTVCRELKGIDTGKMLRSCPGCIEDGIRIMGNKLFGLS